MEMNQLQGDAGLPASRPRFDDSVSQLIRSAERFITQKKFDFARDQLGVARTIDPKNNYIDAIMERLTSAEHAHKTTGNNRYLSVSVGAEFPDGIRGQEPVLSPADLQTRVRQLTTMAERLLEGGSPENAFDTLMKAYLLDPVSPFVLSCEKSILPAWQQCHAIPSSLQQGETVNPMRSAQAASQETPEQEKRLETLKLQKEMERRERDRALWHEASNPPTVFGIADQARKQNDDPAPSPAEERSLFTKLKRGKFLNR
jgi:hypothetical protein